MKTLAIRLSAIAALVLAGCAHQLQFRVVDSSSGRPLANANVRLRERNSFSYFERKPREREVGSTDADGRIAVPMVGSKDVIFFKASGYRGAAAGFVEHGKFAISAEPPPDSTHSERGVVESHGVITIPLLPFPTKP